MRSNPVAAADEQRKQDQDRDGADIAKLFTDDGKDVVIVLLRQVEVFLPALAKAEAEKAARADGIQRLHDLIPGSARIGERVAPRHDALVHIGHELARDQQQRTRAAHTDEQVRELDTADKHHHDRQRHDDDRRRQMRLEHEQDDDAAGDDHERHNAVADRLHLVFVRADHAREKQHDRDLCDLRRLKRRKAEAQPPARAAADHTDVRDPDDGEQENTHAQKQQRPAAVRRHAHTGKQDHTHDAGNGEARLPDEIIRRRLTLRIGAGKARREHHDDADRQQQQCEHEKRQVCRAAARQPRPSGAREVSNRIYS